MAQGRESSDDEHKIYLEEAAYYLHKRGLNFDELSKRFELSPDQVRQLYESYLNKIKDGTVREDEVDSRLWTDIHDDAIGNEKITFVRDDGFYHCKRSDLESMDNTALMSIFESSKKFLDFDIYKRYLGSKPPVGYDPMALQRQVGRAIIMIENILKQRYDKEQPARKPTQP